MLSPPPKKHFIPLYLGLSLNPQWAAASIRGGSLHPQKSREFGENLLYALKGSHSLSSGLKKRSLCTTRGIPSQPRRFRPSLSLGCLALREHMAYILDPHIHACTHTRNHEHTHLSEASRYEQLFLLHHPTAQLPSLCPAAESGLEIPKPCPLPQSPASPKPPHLFRHCTGPSCLPSDTPSPPHLTVGLSTPARCPPCRTRRA